MVGRDTVRVDALIPPAGHGIVPSGSTLGMTIYGPPIQRELCYSTEAGEWGVGDLFLPAGRVTGYPVLLIHGGAWKGLDKESFEFMAPFFLQAGRPVFNINYRLLGTARWPAGGDDCLAAGRFVLEGGLAWHGLARPEKILVCGASAGGHLAMMTGLRLPRNGVEAILSMAGPSRLDWVASHRDRHGLHENFLAEFFGRAVPPDGAEVCAASPALREEMSAPPLFCLHSRNDKLVPPVQSEEACRAWQARGGKAKATFFDGDGELHGFWVADDRDHLRPEVGEFVSHVLSLLS